MVISIGVDILKVSNIVVSVSSSNDPFVKKTYTPNELAIIQSRPLPLYCFATRFAGKEAVFKCLGVSGDDIRLNEIEILERENGQPHVVLHGRARRLAEERKIQKVLVSLSYDTDYAIAYATALNG